jgi:hypothetical protein
MPDMGQVCDLPSSPASWKLAPRDVPALRRILLALEVSPLALPFFAATLFVSAFLLFLVQPMIGKMI